MSSRQILQNTLLLYCQIGGFPCRKGPRTCSWHKCCASRGARNRIQSWGPSAWTLSCHLCTTQTPRLRVLPAFKWVRVAASCLLVPSKMANSPAFLSASGWFPRPPCILLLLRIAALLHPGSPRCCRLCLHRTWSWSGATLTYSRNIIESLVFGQNCSFAIFIIAGDCYRNNNPFIIFVKYAS
jgi:hypothetical protein